MPKTDTQKARRRKALHAWRLTHPEKVKAQQQRSYSKRKNDPIAYARFLKQTCESRKRRAKQLRVYDKSRDPAKINARAMIRNRVMRGTLARQQCGVCGKPDAHAHHDDYANPLDVKWLCPQHHADLHRRHINV